MGGSNDDSAAREIVSYGSGGGAGDNQPVTFPESVFPQTESKKSLSYTLKACYASIEFTNAIFQTIAAVYLIPFYSKQLAVPFSMLASGQTLATIVTVWVQLMMGNKLDSFRTRFGRRKPLLAAIAPITGASIVCLLVPPDITGRDAGVWFGLWFTLFTVSARSSVLVYAALGTELTQDSADRVTLYTWSKSASVLGLLLTPLISLWVATSHMGIRTVLHLIGIPIGIVSVLSFEVLAWVAVEKEVKDEKQEEKLSLVPSIHACISNSQWVVFACIAMVVPVAAGTFTLSPFFIRWVLLAPHANTYLGIAIIAYGVGRLSGMHICRWMCGKIGKIRTFQGFTVVMFSYGIIGFFVQNLSMAMVFFTAAWVGIAAGGLEVLMETLHSDTIDYDELLSGKRREASYQSLFIILLQICQSAASSIPMVIIDFSGFESAWGLCSNAPKCVWKQECILNATATAKSPKLCPVQQTSSVVLALRLGMVVGPLLFSAMSLAFMRYYHLDEEAHKEVLEQIENRKRGVDVRNPITGDCLQSTQLDEFNNLDDSDAMESEAQGLMDQKQTRRPDGLFNVMYLTATQQGMLHRGGQKGMLRSRSNVVCIFAVSLVFCLGYAAFTGYNGVRFIAGARSNPKYAAVYDMLATFFTTLLLYKIHQVYASVAHVVGLLTDVAIVRVFVQIPAMTKLLRFSDIQLSGFLSRNRDELRRGAEAAGAGEHPVQSMLLWNVAAVLLCVVVGAVLN